MPRLIRLYILQCLIGFALSAVLVAGLLWSEVGNLWHLVTHSDVGALAVFMLWLFNGLVLAGVQFSISIMRMAEPEDDDRGGPRQTAEQPVAIPVESSPPRRGVRAHVES